MFKRIKELFNLSGELDMSGWFDQMEAESKASMPKVKPPKGKDISEPVFAMLNAWKQNPKRFVLRLKLDPDIYAELNYHRKPLVKLYVSDTTSKEVFEFSLALGDASTNDIRCLAYFFIPYFTQHKIYPVLGSSVQSKPSWMTQDELEFIIETVKPYYLKRVNRYKDIVESRIDRTRRANDLKSEIAKQKERDRLTGIYK